VQFEGMAHTPGLAFFFIVSFTSYLKKKPKEDDISFVEANDILSACLVFNRNIIHFQPILYLNTYEKQQIQFNNFLLKNILK